MCNGGKKVNIYYNFFMVPAEPSRPATRPWTSPQPAATHITPPTGQPPVAAGDEPRPGRPPANALTRAIAHHEFTRSKN